MGRIARRPCVGSSFGGNRRKRFYWKLLQLIRIFRFAPTTAYSAASAAMLGKAATAGFAPTKSLRSRNRKPKSVKEAAKSVPSISAAVALPTGEFGAPDTRVLPPSADVWDGGAAAAAPCTAVDEIPCNYMDRKGLAAALIAGRNTPSKQIFSVTGRTCPNTQMPSEHTSNGIFQYFSQLLRPLSRARRDNVRRSGLVCRLKRCRRHCCRCARNLPLKRRHPPLHQRQPAPSPRRSPLPRNPRPARHADDSKPPPP